MSKPTFETVLDIKQHLNHEWKSVFEISRESGYCQTVTKNSLRILKYAGYADFKLKIQNHKSTPEYRGKHVLGD